MNAYRIFTIESGSVREGALVEKLTLKGAQTDIPAIIIGEEGRGRQRGVLPVTLTNGQYKEWQEKGRVTILFAEVGTSQSGKPKLFARESGSDEKFICVFRTQIGFRGSNAHTGDRMPSKWSLTYGGRDRLRAKSAADASLVGDSAVQKFDESLTWGKFDTAQKKTIQEVYGLTDEDFEEHLEFAPFPGETLISGVIAEGAAGRMGSGSQLVALVPKNVWFRTGYGGRLYGSPAAHYYRWDGTKITTFTWDERQALEALVEEPAPVVESLPKQVIVDNFSRHEMSVDQVNAIKQVFGNNVVISEAHAPFFKDARDFASQVSGRVASVVAPADFLLEAQADNLLPEGTVMLFWRADEESRKRGNFAIRALLRFTLTEGRWTKDVVAVEPTVEVSFKDGTTFKYGGEALS